MLSITIINDIVVVVAAAAAAVTATSKNFSLRGMVSISNISKS